MASKYWIKLYHEILDDPKMGRLTDRLWRRTIELFLLAGDTDEGGGLPDTKDIAWRLRISNVEELETELHELAEYGILSLENSIWSVTNFTKRQLPMPKDEYMRRLRNKRKRDVFDTDKLQESDQDVTNMLPEVTQKRIDTDKIRKDKNINKELIGELFSCWLELFPSKPKPKLTTKSYIAKIKTRLKDSEFTDNWREAMTRASQSPHLQSSSWFNFGWFIANDTNWQKCLDRNYQSFDKQHHAQKANQQKIEQNDDGSYYL